ncbi:hypothetical protein [Prochlorococcus marinus]|uniref:hypothetical protein n=1 Tax=Prochlorococcus sp. MIT 1342 TaxID=3082532 RepID=UPI0018C871E7
MERLVNLHGNMKFLDLFLGEENSQDPILRIFREQSDKLIRDSISLKGDNENLFYYITHINPFLDEEKAKQEGHKYLNVANTSSSKQNIFELSDISGASHQMPCKKINEGGYDKLYIINSYNLSRFAYYETSRTLYTNLTHSLRRYSSNLEPHYSSFSPVGGQYVYYDCCTENISTLGHRFNDQKFQLIASNPERYCVIAIFGGSAAYSIFCDDNQNFSSVLEGKLKNREKDPVNKTIASKMRGKEIVCINFALPGTSIFEAQLYYTLEALRIHPTITIMHLGWNEARLAATTHPSLGKLGVYVNNFAHTALLNANNRSKSYLEEDVYNLPNIPATPHELVCKNILSSVTQFCQQVIQDNGVAIIGLQPIIQASRTYENPINELMRMSASHFSHLDHYNEFFYSNFPSECRNIGNGYFLNVDQLLYFEEHKYLNPNEFLFYDSCHLSPTGDKLIAEIYYDFILSASFGQS